MKSKKGFTLVELLAVIVVLAIIMVIATMSVNRTITKTRVTSFIKTMDTVIKNAKEIVSLDKLDESKLKERLDYSSDEYEIYIVEKGSSYLIILKANDSGEFKNVDFSLADESNSYLYEDKTICTLLSDDGILSKPDSCGNDSNKNYSVGEVISFTNKDTGKKEEFYVISDDGTTVTALAKYGLLISQDYYSFYSPRNYCLPDDLREKVENYGLQSDTTYTVDLCNVGFDIDFYDHYHSYYPGAVDFGYWYDGSNLIEEYGSSYPADVYNENSSLFVPLEDYKKYFINTLKKKNVKIRLININDLVSLGCNISEKNCKESGREWLYSLSYWTSFAFNHNGACKIGESGEMILTDFMSTASIRPVIEIKKSDL